MNEERKEEREEAGEVRRVAGEETLKLACKTVGLGMINRGNKDDGSEFGMTREGALLA